MAEEETPPLTEMERVMAEVCASGGCPYRHSRTGAAICPSAKKYAAAAEGVLARRRAGPRYVPLVFREPEEWGMREAAQHLNICRGTLHNWKKKGKIRFHRHPSGEILFHKKDVVALQETRIQAHYRSLLPESQ